MTPYEHLERDKQCPPPPAMSILRMMFLRLWLILLVAMLGVTPVTGSMLHQTAPHTVAVVLELADPPLTQVYAGLQHQAVNAAAVAEITQAQLAQIESAQAALLPAVAALGGDLLFRNQRVYNGIALRVDEARLPQLAQLPGVLAVHRLTPKLPHSSSPPLMGAPLLWQEGGRAGVTGAGVTIAVIDTGIDYLHTAFGGPGGGYDTNDPTVVGDAPGYPSAKLIGGYDFAGDAYNANPDDASFSPIPNPDPDPMDCYPHGTGVAAIAAGYGVNANGSTYAGPYDESTDLTGLRIAPGVAPHAQLYALKVFGCRGSSELVDQAIEWAVDPNGDGDLSDHVDVINLSLGSPYGALHDTTTLAAENAAAAGVVVVASAGNNGDTTYVVGSPSVGEQIISVAAGDAGLAAFSARGPRRFDSALKPDLTAPGVGIYTAAWGTGSGGRLSSGTSFAAPYVAGGMALLRQLHPTWTPTELKALAMNSAQPVFSFGGAATPVRMGAGRMNLRQAAATTLLAYNADQPGLVSLSFGAPEVFGVAAAQRNLRIFNKTAQPVELTLTYLPVTHAPGVTFTLPMTTVAVSAEGVTVAPVQMAADASIMHRSRDPTLSPTQLGLPRHWLSEAMGFVLVWPPQPPFTLAASGGDGPAGVTATVAYTSAMRQLAIEVAPPVGVTVTHVTLDRETAAGWRTAHSIYSDTMGSAGAQINDMVTLAAADEALLADGRLSLAITEAGIAEPWRLLVELPTPVIHVPVYAAPRPAAAMRAEPVTLAVESALMGEHVISLTGTGLAGSHPPTDVVSLVSVVELHAALPRLSPADTIRARLGFADLKYVGVGSNNPPMWDAAGLLDKAMLYFGVVVYENWSTPNQVMFNVMIDLDGDGAAELTLYHIDAARHANSRNTSDLFMTALRDLRSPFSNTLQEPLNGLKPDIFDSALFNSSVLLMPVRVSALGLPTGQSDFWFWVESYSDDMPRDKEGKQQPVDRTPMLRYDIGRPALHLAGIGPSGVTFTDAPGLALELLSNSDRLRNTTARGLLLLHHHNVSELRSGVILMDVEEWSTIYAPWVETP